VTTSEEGSLNGTYKQPYLKECIPTVLVDRILYGIGGGIRGIKGVSGLDMGKSS